MEAGYQMVGSAINVRARSIAAPRRSAIRLWLFAAAAFAVAGSVYGFDFYSGKFGIAAPSAVIMETPAGKVIKVPPGGNIQAAIERASGGDVIELQAGGVYSGQVTLPNKPITDFITIRSSAAAQLPEGVRVTPSQRSSMATITSGMLGRAAVMAENGAHHFRFVGIEFTSAGTIFNYGLVVLGGSEKRPDAVPHSIEIDRAYFHPHKPGRSRRGIAANSAKTTITNSYFEGFAVAGEEAQGICGWTGSKDIKIINNYIEGGAQNIMFGGADPMSSELTPSDIEIRDNHLDKPKDWVGKYTIKTIFELKNAKRVLFANNLLTNNWIGSAFRITVRNQDGGANFSTIENVIIRDNVIRNSGDGMNILGKDDTHPSQTLKDLTIENNLFINIAGGNGFDGSGYLLQIAEGENITFANNTAFNSGNIVTFYGGIPRNFVFRDNITGHGNYGIHGPVDLRSAILRAMFQNNLFMNLNGVSSGDHAFPEGNTIVNSISDVGFANPTAGDYRLSPNSRYRGKGRGGKDLGSSLPPREQ
ncbi:MAG: hypothetical protein WBO68_11610 [Pyrinomonadaceae bacterium]